MSPFQQVRHFVIPVFENGETVAALNQFLRSCQVLSVHHEFLSNGTSSCWCYSVRYADRDGAQRNAALGKRPRIDYRDELEPEVFARFAELRKRRKAIAEEEGLPAFAVFTDEELAGIARLATPDMETLRSIQGIGVKKAERFGFRILGLLQHKDGKDEAGDGTV